MNLRPVVLVAAFAVPALAQEHVLFEVQGKDTIAGSIRPADEREAILCRMPRGAVIKAAAKSIDKAGPAPSLELTESGALVEGVGISPKGRGAVLAPFTVPKSGLYKLVVLGDGNLDGDYQVALSWKPQKRFAGTGTTAGEDTFAFAAPPGATVSIALAAAKGSAFVPNLLELVGPQPADVIALPGGGSVKGVALTKRGDWTVRLRNDGGAGGWVGSVKLTFPAPKKHSFDLRDGTLAGSFGGGNTVNGAVIDPALGGLVEVTDPGSPIAGSSVSIPPNSLGQTTSIFVAQTQPYVPPGGDLPAGPAVEFGPAGTLFDASNPATVTIPYDANAFPGGTAALVVYVKNADGTVEPVLPTSSYVFGANTVSFTTSHFSAFQAATTAPRGPPEGAFQLVQILGSTTSDFGGTTGVADGAIFFDPGRFDFFTSSSSIRFDSGLGQGAAPAVSIEDGGANVQGTVTQVNDSTFDLVEVDVGSIGRLRRDVTGDVLLLEHTEQLRLATTLMLRRTDARPTLNALAGRWNVVVWEASSVQPAAGDPTLPLFLLAETGTLTLDGAGAAAFKFAGGVKRFSDFPGGVWNTEIFGKRSARGTVIIGSDAFPELHFGDRERTIGFTVCLGGDVLVAKLRNSDRGFGTEDPSCGLMFLVREASGTVAADILGPVADVLGGVDLRGPATAVPEDPLGLAWRANSGADTFGAGATFTSSFLECLTTYPSDGGEGEISSRQVDLTVPVKFGLSPTGAFTVPAYSVQGAARTGGGLVIYLIRDPRTHGLGFKIRVAPTRT